MINSLGFDPTYLVIGLTVTTFILTVVVIVGIFKMRKLYYRYDMFMRGKDAETLEDVIRKQLDDIMDLKAEDYEIKDTLRSTNKNIRASFQKFGIVKYNAFKGMGGNMSFALAMLDYTNTGFVINSVHGGEGCYLYIKAVDRGQTDVMLGGEEKEALEQALGY